MNDVITIALRTEVQDEEWIPTPEVVSVLAEYMKDNGYNPQMFLTALTPYVGSALSHMYSVVEMAQAAYKSEHSNTIMHP